LSCLLAVAALVAGVVALVGVALAMFFSFVPGLQLAFGLLLCSIVARVLAVALVLCFLHGAPCCSLRFALSVAAPLAVCDTHTHEALGSADGGCYGGC
jgi:hypothetical protein